MGAPGRKNCAKTIGYEPNGGVLLGFAARRRGRCLAPLMTRDAVLPIVAVLAAARDSSVRRLVDELPRRRTATDRLADVPRAVSLALIENLAGGDRSVLPEGIGDLLQIDTTDGVRMTFAGGVIVTVRPSGNAPELRCYVEAECEDRAQAVLEAVLANLRAAVRARR